MAGDRDSILISNNAVTGEHTGRLPASKVGRQLRVPAEFIRECCQFANVGGPLSSTEYRPVDYFATEAIRLWMHDAPETLAERGQPFSAALASWKAKQKEKQATPALIYTNVTVKWRVWGGDRSQTKTTERVFHDCTIRDSGGKFVTVTLADGQTVRKGRDTDGFEVIQPDGVHRVLLRYNRLEARAAAAMTPAEKSEWPRLQRLPDGTLVQHLKSQFYTRIEKRLQLTAGSLARSDLGCPRWQAERLLLPIES